MNKFFEEIVQIRRDIHQNPEIEFDVERTASIAANEMKKLGLEVKPGIGRTGVVGNLKVPEATGYIAFRADMDALPVQEETGLEYRSKINGKAHMCGHDSHTAILIGVAKVLVEKRAELKKNVRFIFQPSEEKIPGGAPGMINDGCLDNVDSIYALHVWPWLETGSVGICKGPAMAAADTFDVLITGKGGHAAAPHGNIDPIIAASKIVEALQKLTTLEEDPEKCSVLTITTFHAGSAHNITPSVAKLSGTMRTYNPNLKEKLKKSLFDIVEKCVGSIGAKANIDYLDGYPPVINDEKSCQKVLKASKEDKVIFPAEKAMFGEDFSYYLQKIPGCFIQLGCRNEAKKCIYPLHSPNFNLDEECMKVGIRLFTNLALNER